MSKSDGLKLGDRPINADFKFEAKRLKRIGAVRLSGRKNFVNKLVEIAEMIPGSMINDEISVRALTTIAQTTEATIVLAAATIVRDIRFITVVSSAASNNVVGTHIVSR